MQSYFLSHLSCKWSITIHMLSTLTCWRLHFPRAFWEETDEISTECIYIFNFNEICIILENMYCRFFFWPLKHISCIPWFRVMVITAWSHCVVLSCVEVPASQWEQAAISSVCCSSCTAGFLCSDPSGFGVSSISVWSGHSELFSSMSYRCTQIFL